MRRSRSSRARSAGPPAAASTQLARFVGAGAVNALVSFVTFNALLALLPPEPGAAAVANGVATAAAVACGYVLNRGWTFRSRAARGPEFARFAVVQLGALAVSSAYLEAAIRGRHWSPAASWLAAAPAFAAVNFLALRYWVFRPGAARAERRAGDEARPPVDARTP